MGRLLDDLNRLNAAAAQGKVLLTADRRMPTGKVLAGAGASPVALNGAVSRGLSRCMQPCGINKAQAIPRHASCDFVGKHYEVVREIGRGSFSRVQLVRERRTGHERVCKVVDTDQMPPEVLELTRAEIQVLATLDHPSIVRLYEYADDPSQHKLVLILEYIAGGDCSGLLEESAHTLSESRVARLVQQLLVATSCCHARGIVHRDIKPQNMMLTRSLGAWGMPDLKLIDFGLAARMHTSRDFVGTPAYMPPEVLDGSVDYTSQADMWSIACTVLELLTGEPPFGKPEDFDGDMEPVFEQIRLFGSFDDEVGPRLEDLPGWSSRSSEAQDFVRRLLRVEPERRMTAAQALNHPWMTKHTPPRTGLTADMVRSMAEFSSAPLLLRCCVFVMAARTGINEQARIGLAFTDSDGDGNGFITRDELLDAMASASVCGWSPADVDANLVFAATDLSHQGRLGFTAFAAACLYGRYGRSADKLAELAFSALDDDRDNLLWLAELQLLLGPEALEHAMEVLPMDRPFGVQEWRAFVRSEAAEGSSPHLCGAPTDGAMSEDEETRNPLLRFFRAFVCEQLLCSGCEQLRDTNDDESALTGEAPVVLCHNYDPNMEMPISHYKVADIPPRLGDAGTAIDFEVVRGFPKRGGVV